METTTLTGYPIIKNALNFAVRIAVRSAVRIEDDELQKIPPHGPLILAANHVNFLDVPVVYTHLLPRPVTGMVKIETWQNPVLGFLFDIWGGIPVQRGAADLRATRLCLQALREKKILAIAPEGTRSGHGKLQKGHPGIVLLALKSQAPILPLAYYGAERYRQSLTSLRRIPFTIRVGSLYRIEVEDSNRVSAAIRQQITDEIMIQIARLLPPDYRGVYAHRVQEEPRYLRQI